MKRRLRYGIVPALLIWAKSQTAYAIDLEPLDASVSAALKSKSETQKGKIDGIAVRILRDGSKKLEKIAFIVSKPWNNQCAHTWVVALDKKGSVLQVRAQNQQCPHAEPTKKESFLKQFIGKGPADVDTLKAKVTTVAKATGSSELAAEAVEVSIKTFMKYQAKL